MDRIAVFVDDAEYAQRMIAPLMADGSSGPTHWVVVMCAPRLTHRIGKWVAHSSREQWRDRWSTRMRERLQPVFEGCSPQQVQWIQARGPLGSLTQDLRARFGSGLAVLDARRPKIGQPMAPVDPAQPAQAQDWKGPVALSGSLSIMLALTD